MKLYYCLTVLQATIFYLPAIAAVAVPIYFDNNYILSGVLALGMLIWTIISMHPKTLIWAYTHLSKIKHKLVYKEFNPDGVEYSTKATVFFSCKLKNIHVLSNQLLISQQVFYWANNAKETTALISRYAYLQRHHYYTARYVGMFIITSLILLAAALPYGVFIAIGVSILTNTLYLRYLYHLELEADIHLTNLFDIPTVVTVIAKDKDIGIRWLRPSPIYRLKIIEALGIADNIITGYNYRITHLG